MASLPYLIQITALKYKLEPSLVAAVIMQESSGNPNAFRFEWGFYRKYLKGKIQDDLPGFVPPANKCSWQTEKFARAVSWGLMQVMGETAREYGYKGVLLTELLKPEDNLEVGCKILSRCVEKTEGDLRRALLRWNGGGNEQYPDEVLARIDNGEAARVLLAC